jgi:primosomal replication protein N
MARSKKASARGGRTVKVALRHGATAYESDQPRRIEVRMAPPRRAERQHARPGSGIKKARGVMSQKTRRRSPK